jgi:hypothetical protein
MTTSDWIAIVGITTTLLTAIIGGFFMLMSKIGTTFKEIGARLTSIESRLTSLEITIAQIQVKVDVLWQHHMAKFRSPGRGEMRIDKSDS